MKIRQANKNDLKEIVKIEKICFPKAEAASEKDIDERFFLLVLSIVQFFVLRPLPFQFSCILL